MTKKEKRDLWTGLLFVSPWLIGLSCFILIPVGMAFYYSLSDFSVLTPPVFIGAENYRDLVADEVFRKALGNTLIYASMALPFGTILALFLALLLNAKIVFRSLFRTIFFLPTLVPLVALAVLWKWIFNSKHGVLNYFLNFFIELFRDPLLWLTGKVYGDAPPVWLIEAINSAAPNWLTDAAWSKPALVICSLWGVGYAIVIYLAGLQDVPKQLYESADIDGAGWWSKTWNITLPMISPVIYFNVIMGSIHVLQEFVTPFVMLGVDGQPARSTLFYVMRLYYEGFRALHMGYACAMGVILFMLIAALTWFVHSVTIRHVYYGGE